MTRALIIGDEERALIRDALAKAMDNPIPIEVVAQGSIVQDAQKPIKLADRPQGFRRAPSVSINLPIGYTVCISFEQQPEPAGMCKHISISVDRAGMIPNAPAIEMILKEFDMMKHPSHRWLEEFEPGHYACNFVEPIKWVESAEAKTASPTIP